MEDETMREVQNARQKFDTGVTEPNPNAAPNRRRLGSVTATKKGTDVRAGSMTFGVEEDEHGNQRVRTTQFSTEPDCQGQNVALLLAYELREHYGVAVLHSSPMEPTDGGLGVITSLRRRGIMAPTKTED